MTKSIQPPIPEASLGQQRVIRKVNRSGGPCTKRIHLTDEKTSAILRLVQTRLVTEDYGSETRLFWTEGVFSNKTGSLPWMEENLHCCQMVMGKSEEKFGRRTRTTLFG